MTTTMNSEINTLKPSAALCKKSIRDFIKRFPKDTELWNKATDELPDLHNYMAGIYNGESPEKPYSFDFKKRSSTPALRNTRHRDGIEELLKLMNDRQLEHVNERFSGWFVK